jgi:hypothetical protein
MLKHSDGFNCSCLAYGLIVPRATCDISRTFISNLPQNVRYFGNSNKLVLMLLLESRLVVMLCIYTSDLSPVGAYCAWAKIQQFGNASGMNGEAFELSHTSKIWGRLLNKVYGLILHFMVTYFNAMAEPDSTL